ncbi:MAG: TMEM165/GDT1 family protein [Fibrobacterota bacterium]
MDWKIFFSTFGLIFLAELGDKTQFAVMAATAGKRSVFSVFAGASVALVLSTFLAIVAGTFLKRYVPDIALEIAAGVLFLVFGVLMLVSAFSPSAKTTESSEGELHAGFVERSVLSLAKGFEEDSLRAYERLAETLPEGTLRSTVLHLAEEEAQHLAHLNDLSADMASHAARLDTSYSPRVAVNLRAEDTTSASRDLINQLIEQERQTSLFYRSLAQKAHFDALRRIFTRLADEEESHMDHLKEYLDTTYKGDSTYV